MRQLPPPIQLLPAFEAAARLESFSKAAQELNVTTSAISQQIKTLESLIDMPLFRREGRRTTLTDCGRQYAETATKVLEEHNRGYAELLRSQGSPVVRISTTAHIAFDVIIPALPDFQAKHPNIDLRIEMSDHAVDFEAEWIDAGVRIGLEDWPELNCEMLCEGKGVPVCAPELHAEIEAAGMENLYGHTLIHGREDHNDWEKAAELLGLDFQPNKQIYFENFFAAITATESGMGVGIGLTPLINQRLRDGRLKVLFGTAGEVPVNLYLVTPKNSRPTAAHEQAYAWLKQLFAGLNDALPLH
ncbi:MAG: LysR substrate-binding domain-containing protein [Gammaproteobacteria bacterium]|nr:LysR substrate-binding domain-containing protein [Gammaproteobacteria bacterium]